LRSSEKVMTAIDSACPIRTSPGANARQRKGVHDDPDTDDVYPGARRQERSSAERAAVVGPDYGVSVSIRQNAARLAAVYLSDKAKPWTSNPTVVPFRLPRSLGE